MNLSNLALHGQLRLEVLPVAKDACHGKNPTPRPIAHAPVVLLEAAVDLDGLPALGMAYVVDGDVVVLAPEEWHVGEGRTLADDGASDGLALPLGQHPVLDAHEAAAARVWPSRSVADRKDPLGGGLQIRVHDNPLLDPQSRLLG